MSVTEDGFPKFSSQSFRWLGFLPAEVRCLPYGPADELVAHVVSLSISRCGTSTDLKLMQDGQLIKVCDREAVRHSQ